MPRLNIYLDNQLKGQVRVAAARAGLTLSQYCVGAIRRRLAEEGIGSPMRGTTSSAAIAIDRARKRNGPLGVSVRDLINEGRKT